MTNACFHPITCILQQCIWNAAALPPNHSDMSARTSRVETEIEAMKSFLVGPQLQYYSPNCLAVPPDFWTTRPTICSRSWCTNALRFAFRAVIGYALTFCSILATWLVFAVWIGGRLTLSDRVPNPY